MRFTWTNYFDDFHTVSLLATAEHTEQSSVQFLELLGWETAKEPKKNKRFAETFGVLGVVFGHFKGPRGHCARDQSPRPD